MKKYTVARYQTKELKQTIDKLLPEDAKIKDATVPYITTAINLHTGKPRIFATPHHDRIQRDGELYAYETALATSAAPMYFPPALVGNERFAKIDETHRDHESFSVTMDDASTETSQIKQSQGNPHKRFDENAIEGLAQSILTDGLLCKRNC